VVVEGAVGNPTALSWQPNKNMLYYINKAGGVSRYGNRDATRLIRADGSALAATGRHRPAHSFLGTKVEPGDVIWVPVDMRPRRASRWKKAIDLTQILGNLAVTYIAIDNASR
jgi:protein involved in polysaccharide export with SLBB domain